MTTSLLMSFSNAGMGSIFATWLRRRIMQKKGLFDTRSVYMDNIAMRELTGTRLTQDKRFQSANAGITLIGASNDDWNAHYLKAMSECSSMIIIATKEWATSEWCWKEFDQAEDRASKGAKFTRIALRFPDTAMGSMSTFAATGWRVVPVQKIEVGGGKAVGDFAEVAAHKGGWVIGETQLQQVLRYI